jgi:hypothetical protein
MSAPSENPPAYLGPFADAANLKRQWLWAQFREICAVIAVRAALRAVPLLAELSDRHPRQDTDRCDELILTILRANAVAIANLFLPGQSTENLRAAAGAADIASMMIADMNLPRAEAAADASAHSILVADMFEYESYATDAVGAAMDAGALSEATVDVALLRACGIDGAYRHSNVAEVAAAVARLMGQPLWVESPALTTQAWIRLRSALASRDDWDVWIGWYEARVKGCGSILPIERFCLAQNEAFWARHAGAVNAAIKGGR